MNTSLGMTFFVPVGLNQYISQSILLANIGTYKYGLIFLADTAEIKLRVTQSHESAPSFERGAQQPPACGTVLAHYHFFVFF